MPTPAAPLARSRRAFLRSVGRAAAALPFYRLIEGSAVHAAGDAPLRFVGYYHPHGCSSPLFNRQAGETDTSFSLGFSDSVLAPFDDAGAFGTSFKSRINVIEGIDLAAGVEKNTNGHDASCIILTGSAPQGDKVANESLDQFLAVTRGLGQKTRVASLALGVGNRETRSGKNISYSKAGAPISKIIDPLQTYTLLFADFVAPAGAGADPAAAQAEAAARLRRGKSVLDNMKEEIRRLEARLPGPERVKMQQFATAVQELEKQLGGLATGGPGGTAGAPAPSDACKKPATPDRSQFPKLEIYNGGEPYLDKITEVQFDLLAVALACDITRFATLFIHLTEDVHNMVAHQFQAANRASVLKLGEYQRSYYRMGARFLQKLQQFGALDSTLVYMSSDMGDPNAHSVRAVPTVLAGSLNGKLKTGRRLVARGRANNKLLVSIAQAFGQDVSSYGVTANAEASAGALSELG
jgi:hypothetical protein